MDLEVLRADTKAIVSDVVERSGIQSGQVFVLGLSSSEVVGGLIGQASNASVGDVIVSAVLEVLQPLGIQLAVQGCEHVNRALVVEKALTDLGGLEVVNLLPTLEAGGSGQVAAFKHMTRPVVVEEIVAQAGLDIGDTAIGMHVKRVQVPLRPVQRTLGQAHVTVLASRPKLIGGVRASYQPDVIRKG